MRRRKSIFKKNLHTGYRKLRNSVTKESNIREKINRTIKKRLIKVKTLGYRLERKGRGQ